MNANAKHTPGGKRSRAGSPVSALLAELDRMRAEKSELVRVLEKAQDLRPALLAQLHYVPECVLGYCNMARAALSKARP